MSKKKVAQSDLMKAKTDANALPGFANLNSRFEQMGLFTRSQGNRGTCSVFTVIGALEYAFAVQQGEGNLLSVEFLNWASHQSSNRTADGAFFSELWDGYTEYGICKETDMPYLPKFDPELKPSQTVLKKAKQAHSIPLQLHWIKEWDVKTGLTDAHFDEIKRTLAGQYPVCGGFRWPKEARWDGELLQMCPPEDVFDGHSVILCGYKDDPAQLGGGVFIIRNSGSASRKGYMSYEYVKAYMNDAVWIEPAK